MTERVFSVGLSWRAMLPARKETNHSGGGGGGVGKSWVLRVTPVQSGMACRREDTCRRDSDRTRLG